MCKEDYVSYDVAKILREKGYDIIGSFLYLAEDYLEIAKKGDFEPTNRMLGCMCPLEITYLAPSLYEAQLWLITKGVFVQVRYSPHDEGGFWFGLELINVGDYKVGDGYTYPSYQEALNEGIKQAINYI